MTRSKGFADLRPIERSVLSEKVAKVITDGLLQGRFQPGDRLVENELAEMLGVSRSPIREALTELSNSGLVARQPGKGAAIRKWTVKDLEDLFAIRKLLEGEVALLVFDHRGEADFGLLEEIVGDMEAAAGARDYSRMIELDIGFHRALWRRAGNRLLEQVLEGLSLQFRLFLTLNWKFHGGLDKVADNHRRLLTALREGPRGNVHRAMDEHVVVENMVDAMRAHAAEREVVLEAGF